MAGQNGDAYFAPALGRTIERVALATLAAVATHAEGIPLITAALIIFVIVAVGEEVGRGFFFRGQRVTLRELAFRRFAERRFRSYDRVRPPRKSRKRFANRAGRGDSAFGQSDWPGGEISE